MADDTTGVNPRVRYEPDENPPVSLSVGLGAQLAMLTVAGVVLTPVIVIRAAGGSADFLSWAVFAAVIVSGVTTVLQAVRLGRIGAGYVLLMGTSGAFISVCITAIAEGRTRHAGDPGRHFLPVPVRAGFAPVAVQAHLHADRRRDRHHADPGCGHADHLQDAGRRAEGRAGRRGAGLRPDCRRRHRRDRPQSDGCSAAVGAGNRDRGSLLRRRIFRHLRCGADRRCGVDRASSRRLAGLRPGFRPGVLVVAAGFRFRHPGRCARDDRRFRRHPACLLAQAAGGGFPRRTGRGYGGRRRQPAVRPRRHGPQHDLFDQHCGHRADRGRRALRRHGGRRDLCRPRLLPQGARRRSWRSRTPSRRPTLPSFWPCSSS